MSLAGTVSAVGGARLANATVTILDGPNAGRSASTNGNGDYQIDGLQRSDANVAARAPSYDEVRGGIFLDGSRRLNFTLRTTAPWSRSGSGAQVFDMPSHVSRVRIVGTYGGRCENFVVYVSRRLVVNEILGTCSVASSRNYDGTHLVTAGVVEVTNSSGINWSLTEIR